MNLKEFKTKMEVLKSKYYKTKMEVNVLNFIYNEVKMQVLKHNVFMSNADNETPTRILNPDSDFTMSEKDFERYLQLIHEELNKRDIPNEYNKVLGYDKAKELSQLEEEIITHSFELLKIADKSELILTLENAKRNYKYRMQLLDMALRLAV